MQIVIRFYAKTTWGVYANDPKAICIIWWTLATVCSVMFISCRVHSGLSGAKGDSAAHFSSFFWPESNKFKNICAFLLQFKIVHLSRVDVFPLERVCCATQSS